MQCSFIIKCLQVETKRYFMHSAIMCKNIHYDTPQLERHLAFVFSCNVRCRYLSVYVRKHFQIDLREYAFTRAQPFKQLTVKYFIVGIYTLSLHKMPCNVL